jgi:hypothetical protein
VTAEDDAGWGGWGITKKDKKKGSKTQEESPEPIAESDPLAEALEPAGDDGWMDWVSHVVSAYFPFSNYYNRVRLERRKRVKRQRL